VARRLHIPALRSGLVILDDVQAHHARNVLRLENGDAVELFDDAGRTASGELEIEPSGHVAVRVARVNEPAKSQFSWSVAAAVPKGERADWMVEKLSELGAARYIPLIAERSVVQPKGEGKRQRWIRLATESAKQSRRVGVMHVEEPMALDALLKSLAAEPVPQSAWFLDTGDSAVPIRQLLLSPQPPSKLLLLIGPEGGWTAGEIDKMLSAHLTAVSLTKTTLRIETAAVAAAACVGTWAP
jgi:16S rRNA (uracil1498-N3)-methyltransferase